MLDIPRRTLGELVARYKFEPSLRDLYVEGRFDVRAMQKFAREMNLNFSVYEIDSVDCTAQQLAELGLPDNCRSRVVWLSQMLAQSLGHESKAVRCIADRDFDRLLGVRWDCGLLLLTDCSSMEVYFFQSAVTGTMLSECVGLTANTSELLTALIPHLQQLFVARAANVKLGWGMSWMPPWKCITLEKNSTRVTFDCSEFQQRYLNKNQRFSQLAEFQQCVSELELNAKNDCDIRGHDAFELLAYWLKQQDAEAKFCDHDVLLAISVAHVVSSDLLNFPLFQKITEWCQSPCIPEQETLGP